MDTTKPAPAPRALPPPSPGPTCHGTGCRERPRVSWTRRLNPTELASELVTEQARREERLLLRDTQQPLPVFGPMPTTADLVHAVYACGPHAIDMDAAALVHAADCAGPNSTTLPECGCTPEPAPAPEPLVEQELPAHWTAAPAGSG